MARCAGSLWSIPEPWVMHSAHPAPAQESHQGAGADAGWYRDMGQHPKPTPYKPEHSLQKHKPTCTSLPGEGERGKGGVKSWSGNFHFWCSNLSTGCYIIFSFHNQTQFTPQGWPLLPRLRAGIQVIAQAATGSPWGCSSVELDPTGIHYRLQHQEDWNWTCTNFKQMINCSSGAPVYNAAPDTQSKEHFYVLNSFTKSIINRPYMFPPFGSLVCCIFFSPKKFLWPQDEVICGINYPESDSTEKQKH